MTRITGTLITNNGFDAFVINDGTGARMHRIGDAQTFRETLRTGSEQDLTNWSGDDLGMDARPEGIGTVIAVNDGFRVRVLDDALLIDRANFHGCPGVAPACAGFVAHDGDLIHGTGATVEQAVAEAHAGIGSAGDVNDDWPEPQASINRTLAALVAAPASAALMAAVEERGGCVAYRMAVNGVLCTYAEESGENDRSHNACAA